MAEGAGDYRSVVRRAEKLQSRWESSTDEEEQSLAGELEELLYRLKKAVLEGDFTQADSYEDEIEDLMETEG